jgi:hypothetical protein
MLWKYLKTGAALGAIAWYLLPRRNPTNLVELMGQSMAMTMRAALGTESSSNYPPPKPFTGLRPEDEEWLKANGWDGEFPKESG